MKMKAADRKMANDLLKAYRDNLEEERRIRKEMTAKRRRIKTWKKRELMGLKSARFGI